MCGYVVTQKKAYNIRHKQVFAYQDSFRLTKVRGWCWHKNWIRNMHLPLAILLNTNMHKYARCCISSNTMIWNLANIEYISTKECHSWASSTWNQTELPIWMICITLRYWWHSCNRWGKESEQIWRPGRIINIVPRISRTMWKDLNEDYSVSTADDQFP